MKKYLLLPAILMIICIVTAFSGCTESGENGPAEFNETSEEESQQIAEAYVKNLDSYIEYHLTEPVLLESMTLRSPYSWQFVYEFDLVSEKDPEVIDTATVTVTVIEGEVVDSVYAQGSRYKLGMPTGSMGVDSLLKKPFYGAEIFVYGTVSDLEKEPAASFKLNWEGAVLDVETVVAASGIEDIENGDWVIVTGSLKAEKEDGNENETEGGKKHVLLAKMVQTEDLSEDEIFSSEMVQVNEEAIVVHEIPGNATAQSYRVRYEIWEDYLKVAAAEEIFENISPENPIELRVDDVKVGSTYTIRALIRNMEGKILSDAEHVGGFGEEKVGQD
ncbi:hypothetical protein MSMTP_2192 [Methanosarcina sp. MTP4]|uniref:hypothetical protein n=1 Tax=Methanosarcina sp. MTP4 TaxID=1434100 RepID=UPI000615DA1B|nr:hypothetical protein [Methanosarcina sp. MTP4]AKB25661.1 hypothetical protein MSMTP_2192 [Methanosarcina sp. MTP4]